VCYFAIERRVFLYDLGQAIRLGRPLGGFAMGVMDFEETVFELREVEWANW
jgi:hypothetical protein